MLCPCRGGSRNFQKEAYYCEKKYSATSSDPSFRSANFTSNSFRFLCFNLTKDIYNDAMT